MIAKRRAACLFSLLATLPIVAEASPVTFLTALPVGRHRFVLDEQYLSMESTHDLAATQRALQVTGIVSTLAYGISGRLTVLAMLPYAHKHLDMTTPSGARLSRGTTGFGDSTVLARYTAYEHNTTAGTLRVAPLFGVIVPTGPDDESDAYGLIPRPLQPGSGAWGTEAGGVVTRQALDYEWDAAFTYITSGTATGFRSGDTAELDGSFQYRLWPYQLGDGLPHFLYGGVEANLVHRQQDRVNSAPDPNSGGTTLYLAPTLEYVTEHWMLETAIQYPVVQNLYGAGLKNDYIFHLGVRLNL